MADSRFYETLSPLSLAGLADLVGGRLLDTGAASRLISGVASLQDATPGDLAFVTAGRGARDIAFTMAGACLVAESLAAAAPEGCAAIISATPQASFAMAAGRLVSVRAISPDAPAVDRTAEIEEGAGVARGAVIGAHVQIGRGTVIASNAVIGPGVAIGRDSYVGAGCVIGFALIGDRVRIHAGAIIGEPGFGAAVGPRGVVDMPQLGRVILQDGVTVGANSCIDRGAFGDTVVGENTKIDNLVQIAHNVSIGRNCVLAAQTGISGSTVVGDGCMLGGRVGISDHVTIGAGVRLAAAAGVTKDVPAGETWGGTPARPLSRWMRESAWLARLARRRPGGDEGR